MIQFSRDRHVNGQTQFGEPVSHSGVLTNVPVNCLELNLLPRRKRDASVASLFFIQVSARQNSLRRSLLNELRRDKDRVDDVNDSVRAQDVRLGHGCVIDADGGPCVDLDIRALKGGCGREFDDVLGK